MCVIASIKGAQYFSVLKSKGNIRMTNESNMAIQAQYKDFLMLEEIMQSAENEIIIFNSKVGALQIKKCAK